MANSLNKVTLIGNCGRDPEMRYLPSGKATTEVSVACGRKWKDATTGQEREETEWFNVVTFDKLAEIVNQYLTKGKQVYFEGRMRTRSWEGQDGQKKYRTEVIADEMILLGGREARPAAAEGDDPSWLAPAGGVGRGADAADLPF